VSKDILKHELVPSHAVLSKSEIEKIFKDLDFEIEHLPRIKINDPVVKSIDAKKGDILEITRDSPTAGTFITYRLVD
jgi:DNA-directed RNA polymerase subunit H